MITDRRHEISRLEAFSDAAFAFALTLLVVSLDVPRSYGDLTRTMRGIPSFACCFALLVWIWHEHNMFFRRYGLQDGWTVVVNSGLMLVTLFYVYPLKFMFDSMFAKLGAVVGLQRMTLAQLANASAIYGFGFCALFILFALLYVRAYRKRDALGLTPVEILETKAHIGHHVVSAGVGLLSVAVALGGPPATAPMAPMTFALMAPLHFAYGRYTAQKRRRAGAAQR
ncbi:MAG TPA: TMEM175 family protein [Vicinamibacterales bacterium]|nr:TMEM175 family protein [Vicinamibacterales bacterium]